MGIEDSYSVVISAIASLLGNLMPGNDTGVLIDTPLAMAASRLARQALAELDARIKQETDGAVSTASQTAKLKACDLGEKELSLGHARIRNWPVASSAALQRYVRSWSTSRHSADIVNVRLQPRHASLIGSGPCSRVRQLGRSWPSPHIAVKVSAVCPPSGAIGTGKETTTGMSKRWILDSGAKCNRAKQTGFARLCLAL